MNIPISIERSLYIRVPRIYVIVNMIKKNNPLTKNEANSPMSWRPRLKGGINSKLLVKILPIFSCYLKSVITKKISKHQDP